MNLFTAPLALQGGATITLHAWPYRVFAARYSDFRNLLDALAPDPPTQTTQGLLERVLEASVPDPADRAVIAVPDLPQVLEAIQALNHLVEVAAKPISLRAHLTRAEQSSQVPAPRMTSPT